MKSNKQIVDEMKQVLKNTSIRVFYRNRNGKEYITIKAPFMITMFDWNKLRNIVRTAFPNARCTSGSADNQTYRIF